MSPFFTVFFIAWLPSDSAWYSQILPGTARYCVVQPGTAGYSRVQPGTAWYGQVQPGTESRVSTGLRSSEFAQISEFFQF